MKRNVMISVKLGYVPMPFTLELDVPCSVHASFTRCCSSGARPDIRFFNIAFIVKNWHVKLLSAKRTSLRAERQ